MLSSITGKSPLCDFLTCDFLKNGITSTENKLQLTECLKIHLNIKHFLIIMELFAHLQHYCLNTKALGNYIFLKALVTLYNRLKEMSKLLFSFNSFCNAAEEK